MKEPILYTSLSLATPLGEIFIASTSKGICDLAISRDEVSFLKLLRLKHTYPTRRDDRFFRGLAKKLEDYIYGKPVTFDTVIDVKGTSFEKRVWKEICKISYGETRSYVWIAREIGNPKASRAVGQACRKNPVPIIIPCHRVVASNGHLGGYSGGIWIKERLLRMEAPGRRQNP
ncbi:MAG: methylated-DNA--[protein]-cysteine S-methyltransferase [Deltaproteobacteria bacterium]|nr:methylated-DNA--[protein]-cysteine S-methyltransferase [Deltaproteobacteria bacterium]